MNLPEAIPPAEAAKSSGSFKPNLPDRWQRIEDLFHDALDRPPESRAAWLDAACASDAALRAQVERLLRAHEREGDFPVALPALPVLPLRDDETGEIPAGAVIGHYQVLSLLGRGGMGAVYLAMHLGTRRYVALKVIAPQLMRQPEFVTRFRREAEAAGRLRHPNVVDVTDFGFAPLGAAEVAYLVMEYLDGCTLADILAEEHRLPLMWVVDILEQVCSAVDEAHQQGTIHRDLKPENIWLEPNRRGGYTVKVLDFGLAKLARSAVEEPAQSASAPGAAGSPAADDEAVTLRLPGEPSASGDGLTRLGSRMGTPLYMSPEQCRGEPLSPQSDLYSLGVVAYQMLSGRTPFAGGTEAVIQAQLETPPPPLREVSPKTPRKIAALVMSALAKTPAARPASASAFANALRAQAEGTGALIRRSFALYSEHFPAFIKISALSYLPAIVMALLQFGNDLLIHHQLMPAGAAPVARISFGLLDLLVNFLCGVAASGAIVPVVIQLIVAPLRPIRVRAAFAALRRRLRPFLSTSLIVTVLFFGGLLLFLLPGLAVAVLYTLYVPVVMVEDLKNWAALRRSQALVFRTPGAAILIAFVLFALPAAISALMGQSSVNLFQASPRLGPQFLNRLVTLTNLLTLPWIVILTVLLYLRTRQAGGETIRETLAQFETEDLPRRNWQRRMRERLPGFSRP
jgi:serine/threonine protein kinase